MTRPLSQHGLIGDLHTAAIVDQDGAIVWMCIPRFDSDACFVSLLGDRSNGQFRIAPVEPVRSVTQTYESDTLILVTTFVTDSGTVRVTDFMPVREKHARIVRVIEGVSGSVEVSVDLLIRFDYGLTVPWVRREPRGTVYVSGPQAVLLQTDIAVEGRDLATQASVMVSPGDRHAMVLAFYSSTENPPRDIDPFEELHRCRSFWRGWVSETEEDYGSYDSIVRRSLISLKALTYAPTGGMIAAVTAALPEQIGGARNWDYRYCWLRDASFALGAFVSRGHREEAKAWRAWLLRAVAGSASQLQIMYGVAGERRIPELELDWLPGYRNSRPVRIGNAASNQFQLDVYGEVIDAIYQMHLAGIRPDPNAWQIVSHLTDHVISVWMEPDDGIWEIRGERQHFTHSKIMAWVAVDRALKMMAMAALEGPARAWTAARDEMHATILREGYNAAVGAFTQSFGSTRLDAAVLLAPIMGFIDANDPRMLSTTAAIRTGLDNQGFVMRYEPKGGVDGIEEPEGVFLPCSFWLVENLAMQGDLAGAEVLLERLIGTANSLGIFTEEYDPSSGEMVGNFAQAFTHVGLVCAVQRVVEAQRSKQHGLSRAIDSREEGAG
ncbi:MAG: glycoside hydrolase family 15 protein [Ferrimicrobium sp.]